MAGIQILDVYGIPTDDSTQPPGTIAKLIVELDMGDCGQICKQVSIVLSGSGQTFGPVVVDVTAQTAELDLPPELNQYISCGSQLLVSVTCSPLPPADNSECATMVKFDTKDLRCEQAGCPPEAGFKVEEIDQAGNVINEISTSTIENCLPAGSYRITVVDPPEDPNNIYAWIPQSSGSFLDIDLAPGEEILISVAVLQGSCLISGALTLTGCVDCAEKVCLEVVNEMDEVVTATCPDESPNPPCLEAGKNYKVRVTEPTGDGITYSWSLNDVHVEGASGSEYPFDLMVGQDIKISVAITAEGCDALPGSVTVKGGANCGSQVCLEVVNETGEVVHETCADDNPQCLEAGKYMVRVVEPEGDNLAYSWSLNDELVEEPYGLEYPLDLMAGQDVKIGVAITANCCPALPGSVTLKGEHVCPETLELALTDSQGEPVETADCLPIGDYTLTVVTPEADALDLIWYVNGAPYPNQTNTSLTYSLGEGETVIISVEAVNCCDRRPYGQQLLEACDCPEDNLGITVMRDGVPIPPGGCVDPGFFTAQVSGDLGNATLNWTQDGNLLGNGNTVGFTFDQTWGDDCNGPPSTTITVTAASDDPNCPPQSVSTTLTTCGQFTLEKCVPCWLLKLGILLSAGIFAIALAIFLCPVVVSTVVSPIPIPAWEPVAVIIVSAAPWVALAAAAVGVILWGIWRSMCQPDLCGGWLVLIWQLLVGIGVVFIYFGLCPACLYLLIPGFGLFLSGIGVFIYWIIICRPSMCKIFFEIGNLALVQLVVGWLQIILGACIWTYGPFLMAIWQTALFAVGWIGFIWACFAAPPQN